MTNSTIICVLGTQRSGTSLTAKILNLLGVYLGPEEHLRKPSIHNPKGYWEHAFIHELNLEILSRLNGSPMNPATFPEGWESFPQFDDLKEKARFVIQEDFADAEVWGWKDPATCLTLPFWKQLLSPIQYVICLRNPIDVAFSRKRVFDDSFELSLYIWLVYLKSALKHTSGEQRIFISSEKLVSDYKGEITRLSRFLGRPKPPNTESEVWGFVDENMWHHRTDWEGELRRLSEFRGKAGCAGKSNLNSEVQVLIDDNLQPRRGSTKTLHMALQVNEILLHEQLLNKDDIMQTLREAINRIDKEAKREARRRQIERDKWIQNLRLVREEITALVTSGDKFILVDEGLWRAEDFADRHVLPFLERDGSHWGNPPDNETAIQEVERMRLSGAGFMVFAWPAFWWFEYYAGFYNHLRSNFRRVLENDRLVVFDLRA